MPYNDPEIRMKIFNATSYVCQMPDCYSRAEHIHHIKADTKPNNKRWPLYINSPFNMMAICSTCHLNKPLPKAPNDSLCYIYEEYLDNLKES